MEVSGGGRGKWRGGERGQRELFQQDRAIFKNIHRVGGVGYKPIIKPTPVFS